jgi:hypothetical protein
MEKAHDGPRWGREVLAAILAREVSAAILAREVPAAAAAAAGEEQRFLSVFEAFSKKKK